MNQFANIGSMFPGANHKQTRDKAKEILSSHSSFEITGIVITNQATKKKHYIDQGIHGELDHNTVISETLRCQGIAAREYGYWKEGGDGCEGCICAMGAAANILASIARGLSPEGHDEWKKSNGHEPVGPMSETASQFVNDVKSHMDELEEMFSLMLIAEVKRHGGIPKLSEEEMKFRDTLSEFLMTKAHWSQIPEIMAYNQPGGIKQGPTVKEVMDEVEQAKKGGNNG
jgi:hypothetical protein